MAFFDFQLAGYWNAATNDRGLKSGKGIKGQVYQVSVAGATNLDGYANWAVDDLAFFNEDRWTRLPGGNALSTLPVVATGTTTARTLGDRFAERINIKDFGATGSASDNATTAFIAAKNAAQAATEAGIGGSGGRIFLPDGFYPLAGGALVMSEGILIEGDNPDRTCILRTGDGGATCSWIAADSSHVVRGGGLKNLTISDVNHAMTFANSPFHLEVDFAEYMRFEDVRIYDGMGAGRFKSLNGSEFENINFYCTNGVSTNRVGIQFVPTAIPGVYSVSGGDIWLDNVNIQSINDTLDYCLDIQAGDGFWIDDIHCLGGVQRNVRISRNTAASLFNLFFTGAMLDISKGGGLLIEGSQPIITLEFQGRCSSAGLGTRPGGGVQNGIEITNPGIDIALDVAVEGYKGHGIYVDAAIEALAIRARQIRGNNADGLGGSGVLINRSASVTIDLERIGGGAAGAFGTPTQDYGILLASANAKKVDIRGVRIDGNVTGGIGAVLNSSGSYDTKIQMANNGTNVVNLSGGTFVGV
jgi:hypothetical protein